MFSTLPESEQPPMMANYSHFQIVKGGVIFSSNKAIKLPKIYMTNEKIAYITYF